MLTYKERFAQITTLIFDVDGVFTDSSILLLPDGEQARTMSTRDGYAVQLAVKSGVRVAIISGGSSEAVRTRMNRLGVQDVFLSVSDKLSCLNTYLKDNNTSPEEVLYMGDDIPDYDVMRLVGLPVCPQNAVPEIKSISRYISPIDGGQGCVRDVVEQFLKIQGKWPLDTSVSST